MKDNLVHLLKKKRLKVTPIRKVLLEIFEESVIPLSIPEILLVLEKKSVSVNKTTLYRQTELLVTEGILKEVEFGEGKKRYELESERHHHHLVCIKCNSIEDFQDDICLDEEERRIGIVTSFKVIKHQLEFFGLCKTCLTI